MNNTTPTVHWHNPWQDSITVPIEELVECVKGIGERWSDLNGNYFIMTKEDMLSHWKSYGDKLDAYVLECVFGMHCIGIRYGNDGSQYLSPACDYAKAKALIDKHRSK